MTRWWISWARTPRITARPCSSATAAWWAIASSSCRSSSENGVSRSQTSSPIWRRFQRSGSRTAWTPERPSGHAIGAVLEHERSSRRADGGHRRLDDRLERLLEVERLGDRFGDPRQSLELVHAALRLGVELGVLDRMRRLRGDRDEQVDLGLGVLARRARADVECPGERVPGQDRHGQDRLVLVLGQVGKLLETRVEVRVGGDRDRGTFGGRGPRDSLSRPEPRAPRHLLDARAVRRAEDELVGALVVEVDETGVGGERVGDLRGDEREHLLEVERRVDRGDRLRQQPQMASGGVHGRQCRRVVRLS